MGGYRGNKATKGPGQRPRPEGFGEPGPGGSTGPPGPDQAELGVPSQFLKRLEKAGLRLSKNGNRVVGLEAGKTGSKDQLALLQEAHDRFGIGENQSFDPRRVAYDPATGEIVDLSTGVFSSGQGVASDATLALLRAQSGYDPQVAFEIEQKPNQYQRQTGVDAEGNPIYETYTAAAFQTLESYTAYKEAARANYLNPPMEGGEIPEEYRGLMNLDDDKLGGLGDAAANLLRTRRQRQKAQSFYGDTFNLDEEF